MKAVLLVRRRPRLLRRRQPGRVVVGSPISGHGIPSVWSFLAESLSSSGEELARLRLNSRAGKEVRVHLAVEADGIDEGKLSELVSADEVFVNRLVRLLETVSHVAHVPMADVRPVDRLQGSLEGQHLGLE